MLIIAGSNQFLDNFGGPWAFPYTLLKWSIVCRLAGCRLFFVSVGAGPLDAALSRTMVRACLPLADYVSFRDVGSRRLIVGDKPSSDWPVYPDLAHSLRFRAASRGSNHPRANGKPVVGINPVPLYDDRYWCSPDRERYRAFVNQLAAFTNRLLRDGYPVFFFPTHPKDADVAKDVINAVRASAPRSEIAPLEIRRPRTSQELMSVIAEADIVVASRFHGILLALHAWKPVLAICYYRKARELMRELEQEQSAADLDELDAEDLWGRSTLLEQRAAEAQERIEALESKWREALEQQYSLLFRRFERIRKAVQTRGTLP